MAEMRVDDIQKQPELSEAAMSLQPQTFRVDDVQSMQPQALSTQELDIASLGTTDAQMADWKKKGKIGYFEQAQRMQLLEKIPVIGLPILAYEAGAVLRAKNRIQADDYKGNDTLKTKDYELMKKTISYAAEEQARGFSFGGNFIEGASNLPAYMIEFLVSGGIAATGGRMAGKATVRAGLGTVTGRGVAWGTRAAVRTATVGAPRVAAGTMQNETNLNLIPTDKGLQLSAKAESQPFTSFTKAFGDTFIEYFSEEAGSLVINPAIKRVAAAPFVSTFAKKVTEIYSKVPGNKGTSALFTKAGWDGMVSEVGEEILGDQLRAVFNVNDFGKPDGSVFDRMLAAIPNGDELAVMMGVLAVPGAAKVALSSGANALDVYREQKKLAGQPVQTYDSKTLAGQIQELGYDPVVESVKEATSPLPTPVLSKEELAAVQMGQRSGEAKFEESKPAPARVPLMEITSTREFQQADIQQKFEMLVRGRTAALDAERNMIETRMDRLEQEIQNLNKIGRPDVAILENKQGELNTLSKQLMSVHAQIADTIDATVEEVQKEKVLLPGASLEVLRLKAREAGARIAQQEMATVFRNRAAQEAERRTALVKYLQARLPGSENAKLREKYMLRAAKGMTEAKLQKFFAEIEGKRETVRAKQLRERAHALVEKMSSKINASGVKQGIFNNPNIQALADMIVKIANNVEEDAQKAMQSLQDDLQNTQEQLAKLIDEGLGETTEAYLLRYRTEVIQNVGGIEQRDATALEDSIRWLTKQLEDFRNGRDAVRGLRELQRASLKKAIIGDMNPGAAPAKNFGQALWKKTGDSIRNVFSFNSFHLAEFWRELSKDLKNSQINTLVVDRLEKLPLLRNGIEQQILRPFRKALSDIYGLSQQKNAAYVKFVADRMSIEDTKDAETAPYDSKEEIELNNGTKRRLRVARAEVMYWYAVTHTAIGEQDAEALESLTGENALAAKQEQATLELGEEADEEDVARRVEQLKSEVKGNAIPYNVLMDMFSTLTQRDMEYAIRTREAFSATWPMINEIYRRAMNVDLDRTKSYIPWIKKPSQQQVIADVLTAHSMVAGHVTPFPGFTKVRRPSATAPFAQISIFEVMDSYAGTMSHWVASYEIVNRLQTLLKDGDVREAINRATDGVQNKKTGEWKNGRFITQMDAHLKGIASRGATDRIVDPVGFEAIRRNMSRYFLADPKQFIMQLSSAIAAIDNVGHIEFAKGLLSFMRNPKGAYAVLKKGLSLYKRGENIQVELREIQDQINQYGKAKEFLGLKLDKSTIDRYSFLALTKGDISAITLGGWAVFRSEFKKTGNVAKAYEAFDKFTIGLMQSSVREQQPTATTGASRLLFQFISAVSQYTRAYYRSWANLIKDPSQENIQKFARTMVVYHVYIPYLRWALANLFVPPPEDEEEEDPRNKQLIADMVAGPVSGLWMLGHIASLAAHAITGEEGFDSGPAVVATMDKTRKSVAQAMRKAMDEDAEMDEVIDSIFKAEKQTTGLTAGVPSWLNDSVQMLYTHSQGDWENTDTPGILYGHSVEMLSYHRRGQ